MSAPRRSSFLAVAGSVLALLSTVAGSQVTAHGQSAPTYTAEIRRTAHGIPHILASDFGGLGFGFGYAFAEDDICPMAEDYVTAGRAIPTVSSTPSMPTGTAGGWTTSPRARPTSRW